MFDIKCVQNHRVVLHIDADAFFASVEQVLNPKLKGKAVIVGGPSKTRGIVSTSSYEAKRMGIKSGMPTYKAFKICPEAILVSGNFKKYNEFSEKMFEIFSKYTPLVEMVSIDEAYLDITGMDKYFKKSYDKIARDILLEVQNKLGITVSCGLSINKTISKVASSINKPNKLTIVPFGKERDFLKDITINNIPFCGKKSCEYLNRFGVYRCKDLANYEFDEIIKNFGLSFVGLWKKCRGIDNDIVKGYTSLPKSISKEHTFYERPDRKNLISVIKNLAKNVFFRLRKNEMTSDTVAVKFKYKIISEEANQYNLKFNIFRNKIFQKKLEFRIDNDIELFSEMVKLFEKNYDPSLNLRLIGVKVSGLSKTYNLNLFDENNKHKNLFKAVDSLNNKFEKKVISALN